MSIRDAIQSANQLSLALKKHMFLKIYLHSLYKVDVENANRLAIQSPNYLFKMAMPRLKSLADLLRDLPSTFLSPEIRLLGAQACSFYAKR
jgi:hypothetical protein